MENFQSIRRHATHRRHVKSGMTTHMSDVDSIHSFKPHIHIDMLDEELEYPSRGNKVIIMNFRKIIIIIMAEIMAEIKSLYSCMSNVNIV